MFYTKQRFFLTFLRQVGASMFEYSGASEGISRWIKDTKRGRVSIQMMNTSKALYSVLKIKQKHNNNYRKAIDIINFVKHFLSATIYKQDKFHAQLS